MTTFKPGEVAAMFPATNPDDPRTEFFIHPEYGAGLRMAAPEPFPASCICGKAIQDIPPQDRILSSDRATLWCDTCLPPEVRLELYGLRNGE